ncbi:MAG: HNH endonuclease [Planctomycetota bacterium]
MPASGELDTRLRAEAFKYLARLTRSDPDTPVYWKDLVAFTFEGHKCPLIGARGIWKPGPLDLPISLTTAPVRRGQESPYEDEIREDDTIVYRYQGTDLSSFDNVGLLKLLSSKLPVIYFHGIDRGVYLAAWPAFVVSDLPHRLAVILDVSPTSKVAGQVLEPGGDRFEPKRYIYVPTRKRLHQQRFRVRVMRAYRRRCAICRIGHVSLLDAAHIIPDTEDTSPTTVNNGLSLCKIHHAAFDQNIVGIDPDLMIHVREDILEEHDGPMLLHGIKETHHQHLRVIPRSPAERPSPDGLAERFARFLSA